MESNLIQSDAFFHSSNWQGKARKFGDVVGRNLQRNTLVMEIGVGPRNQRMRQPMMQFADNAPGTLHAVLHLDDPHLPSLADRKPLVPAGDISATLPDTAAFALDVLDLQTRRWTGGEPDAGSLIDHRGCGHAQLEFAAPNKPGQRCYGLNAPQVFHDIMPLRA